MNKKVVKRHNNSDVTVMSDTDNNINNHNAQDGENAKKNEKELDEEEEEEDFDIDYLLQSPRRNDKSNTLKCLNNDKKEQAPTYVIQFYCLQKFYMGAK